MSSILDRFYTICTRDGNLEKIVEYIECHRITSEDARSDNNRALRGACICGCINVAKYLVARFGLTKKDVLGGGRDNNFSYICAKGQLEIIQWLVSHFSITKLEFSRHDNLAFNNACKNGQFKTAQWLATHFKPTKDDIINEKKSPFRYACYSGYTHIAQWLIDDYGLTREDAYWIDPKFLDKLNWDQPLGPKSASKLT